MKILFLKLFLISVVVIALSEVLFGLVIPRLVLRSGDTYIDRWRDFYTKRTGAELVCLGSSRIHRHCDPNIISSITHLKTEVVATAGAKYYFFEKLYEDYLKRNPKPKLLIVGIDLTGLGCDAYVPNPEYFMPFIRPSDAVAGTDEFYLTRFHRPLGYFYYKEIYYDEIQNPWARPHVAGFLPEEVPTALDAFLGKLPGGLTLELCPRTMGSLIQFMRGQQDAGTACIGIITPEYYPVWAYENNRQTALNELYDLAAQNQVRIINFSTPAYKLCYEQNYFYNSEHLNKAGAELFSRDLADSINQYYH